MSDKTREAANRMGELAAEAMSGAIREAAKIEGTKAMRSLSDAAKRIVDGYREVCETMTPHAPCNPEESSDSAVRLAVHFLKLQDVQLDLMAAYNCRDDVAFDRALKSMRGEQ